LIDAGLAADRVFVLGNTIDVEAEAALREQVAEREDVALRSELGLKRESAVLLFVGRIYAEKRVEELIAASERLRQRVGRPVEVVVIGDGPGAAAVAEAAAGVAGIHLRGEIRDPLRVAEYMRIATALVIPGKVGLAVNHAFAHGLPVVTMEGDWHAPEVEYLIDGVNGRIVPATSEAFDDALARLVEEPEWQAELSAGALRTARGLGVEAMAERFDAGVAAVLARSRRER
jgi:glycosyltransferase involved in cell wall biosynthesis